jgi:tRNA(Ile)-lysidine synthase
LLSPDIRDLSFENVELARKISEKGQVGSQSTLAGNVMLRVGYDHLNLTAEDQDVPPFDYPQLQADRPLALHVPGYVELKNDWIMTLNVTKTTNLKAIAGNKDPWTAYLDFRGDQKLYLRSRIPGERFQPLGMGGKTAKVSRVMVNRKIPVSLRERWPIVANRGHLLWLVGHHLDERARVTGPESAVLQIRVEKVVPS